MHRGIAVLLLVKLRTTKSSFWKLFAHFDIFFKTATWLANNQFCAACSVLILVFYRLNFESMVTRNFLGRLGEPGSVGFEQITILFFCNSWT